MTQLDSNHVDVSRRQGKTHVQSHICDLLGVTMPGVVTSATSQFSRDPSTANSGSRDTVVLSLFPGADLLGKGFEQAGYCILRGPDLIFGGDIRTFNPPHGIATGIIGGPPCQDYSKARRTPPTGYGDEMLSQFARVVLQVRPDWFLMENVPSVPDVRIDGYTHQRLDLRANEFGLTQSRLRHFQFGSRTGRVLIIKRGRTNSATQRCCLASEGEKPHRRKFADFCELQGLPRDYDLPSFTRRGKYRAVGNGVPVPMAYAVANAIRYPQSGTPCACSCGRPVTGKQTYAMPACRKRAQRLRDVAANAAPGLVTGGQHVRQTSN